GEKAQRTTPGLYDSQTVARTQPYGIGIQRALEVILLPRSRSIAPDHTSAAFNREAPQPSQIFVRHRRLLGPGDRFLPEQIRAPVNSELQSSREKAHLKSRKRDLQTGSVSFDLTRDSVVAGPRALDFVGLARQVNGTITGARIPGDA